ncbi:MAG: hypothetical protein CM1200mP18_13890 [Gammaproteobacteria bacterium]|nr:MAG: hypothetical protein CM1200mP18_13890 [Gammaproteobacteria bacterium]
MQGGWNTTRYTPRPSRLRPSFPAVRLAYGAKPAKAGAMGYLIKTVFGGYRPNLNRLKQQIIAFVAQRLTAPNIVLAGVSADGSTEVGVEHDITTDSKIWTGLADALKGVHLMVKLCC